MARITFAIDYAAWWGCQSRVEDLIVAQPVHEDLQPAVENVCGRPMNCEEMLRGSAWIRDSSDLSMSL